MGSKDILGIQTWVHDAACVYIEDGKLKGAVEEERFVGKKHTGGFCWGDPAPENAINWCLKDFNIDFKNIDYIAFPYDINLDIVMATTCRVTYYNLKKSTMKNIMARMQIDPCKKAFYSEIYGYFKRNAYIKRLAGKYNIKPVYVKHHLGHASSTFRCSGFDKANILVVDSIGEKECTSLYVGDGNEIKWLKNYPFSQSLGSLYRTITYLLGLGPYGEGKTMALASYGEVDEKFAKMIEVSKHDYGINPKVVKELGKYARYTGELKQVHKNIATTLQAKLEEACLELVDYLYEHTGYKKLCLAGGVSLNCKLNGVLLNSEHVDDIFIQPSADDAGSTLGAALEVLAMQGYRSKIHMEHPYWGPGYSNDEIKYALKKAKACDSKFSYDFYDDIEGVTAELLADNKVIGWFQGRMEFGPRALGNRSILASPLGVEMQDIVNDIKHREHWRPLAPSILDRDMGKYFERPHPSPFMIISFEVKRDRRAEIPAVVHVDGSARAQTVSRKTNPRFYNLIRAFEKETGTPILMNTSFNDKGQPIVRTPMDAIETFEKMHFDYLAAGNYLVKLRK